MATITFPNTPAIAEITWTPPAATHVNRSEWTGRRRATILPDASFWRAKVTLPMIMGEAECLAWRAFVLACNGQANNFDIVAVEAPQNSETAVKIMGAGQTGLTLTTDGWTGGGYAVRAGQMVTIGGQLLTIAADSYIVAGVAALFLSRRVRVSPADNADVEVRLPYARMSMASDDLQISALRGQMYGFSFDCEEDF